jgi:tryptophan synthase beta chain
VEKKKYRIVGVEPSACPSLTKGELRYDFGDTAETTPLLMMYTLGHKFMPPPIHAGGLRYHGMSPMVSHALKLGLIEAEAYHQTKVFEAATQFARTEGIVPAPESAHAIAAVVEEAKHAREAGTKRVILFNLSGHGLLDLSAYETYLSGKLQDA